MIDKQELIEKLTRAINKHIDDTLFLDAYSIACLVYKEVKPEYESVYKKLGVAHENLDLILASGPCDRDLIKMCYRGLGFDEEYIKDAS